MRAKIFFSIVTCILFLSSCNYEKKLHESLYFNDKVDSSHLVTKNFEAVIQVDDRISIFVSALNPESAVPYNPSSGNSMGYLVEKDGTIRFPQLGKILVEGKTLIQVRNELLTSLSKYLTDPNITVQFANAKVLVMGEVGHPGSLSIPDGKLNILEAIILSGDVPFTGKKDNVLVIREEDGKRTFARVNLQTHDIYKSPYYQLKQNDLIYVEATKQKIRQQANQVFLSNISFITSLISVFTITVTVFTLLKR